MHELGSYVRHVSHRGALVDGTLPGTPPATSKAAVHGAAGASGRLTRLLPRGIRGTQLLLLLTLLVPLLMVQAGIYYSWFQTRRDAELQANLELARAVATNFDAYVRDIANQELAIGIAFSSTGLSTDQQGKLLVASAQQYPAIRYYSWVSPQGLTLASSDPMAVGFNANSLPYFRDLARGKQWVVSDLIAGEASGDETFFVGRAARDQNGIAQGIVLAAIDPTKLNSSLLIQRSGDASFALFDRHGIMVYRDPETPSWEERVRIGHDPSVLKALAGQEATATVIGVGGEERIGARVPIQSIGWAAGASRSVSGLMTPLEADLAGYAGVSVLVTLAAAIGALIIERRITVPLRRLRQHALAIGSGEFGHEVIPDGPAELADLAGAFNRMAAEVRRREEELTEAVSMRDEFFSVAAHELKTPITSLRGFAQLAIRQLDKEGTLDPARARQVLQVIDQQSRKLSDLVTQLLDASRLEDGRLMLNKEPTDLVELVRAVMSSVQGGTEQHEITLHAPPSLTVVADPLRLEQVFTNLFDNAIKYSPLGGEIEVQVESPDGEAARISVRDHGIGIPEERRARIFDRFYQAHGNNYLGGMGLGLYISREIVVLHGGEIKADFPEDGGTRFVVSVPRGSPTAASSPQARTE